MGYNIPMSNLVKLVVFVPLTHSDVVRKAMGDAGSGVIGNYSHCSYSSIGHGRFMPLEGAHPNIGEVGKAEIVVEERIETLCSKEKVKDVIKAMREVHPYEEVAFDIIPLLDESEL